MKNIKTIKLDNIKKLNKSINDLLEASPDESIELKEDSIGTQMIDFFEEGKKDIDKFDDEAWNTGEGYKLPNFPMITEKLEGLSSGLYLLAGPSNAGKSAAMMNIMHDACMHEENKLFGIYFSLDDSRNEIIPRVVAMDQRIPISVVAKPARYKNFIEAVEKNNTQESDLDKVIKYEEYLLKREEGLNNLRNNSNKFKIEDSTRCTSLKEIEEYIQNAQEYIKSIDSEMNLIVAIDSINDIQLGEGYTSRSNNEKMDIVSREVKHWSVKYNIPILSSTHLRKLNGNRRPIIDDLKESNTLQYEASVVWLVYNDVSANKNAAKVYYAEQETEDGIVEKKPILEMDWAKNKKSSFKGRTFNYFSPEYSKAIECDENISKRFSALIYEG